MVGVSHECDWPPGVAGLPRVTHSGLDLAGKDGGAIEIAVAAAAARGQALYSVDAAAVRELRPDLVVAQDVCHVCAVPADQVAAELDGLAILRQHPHSLEDVFSGIEILAAACGVDGSSLARRLRDRVEVVRAACAGRRRLKTVFLEWLDPPYRAGHWTPDLLEAAGLEDPLARPGIPSVPVSWDDVRRAGPELLVLAPCGFDQRRAEAEARRMAGSIEAVGAEREVVLDGNAYFNRPGPRLAESLELLARSARP